MMNQVEILGQVAVALLFGSLIGWEREVADKPAGVRTHMLVAGAASLLVGLSRVMIEGAAAGAAATSSVVQADPIRVMEAIVTGVAVLGAGTILRPRDRNDVEGLTTAASLFFAAAIGIACALDRWLVAAVSTLVVWSILRLLGRLQSQVD